jgi:hypothetical protein
LLPSVGGVNGAGQECYRDLSNPWGVNLWRERAMTAALVVAALIVMVAWRSTTGHTAPAARTTVQQTMPTTTTAARRTLRATPTTLATTTTAPPTTTTTTTAPPTTTTTTTAPPTTTTTAVPSGFRQLTTLDLTQDHGDRYVVTARDGGIRYEAPASNQRRNLRVVTWDPTSSEAQDQEVCSTWTGETDDMTQQGVVLRIRQDGGRFRAVSVTKNIVMAAYSQFNVHTWDSARTGTYSDGRPAIIHYEGSVHLQGMIQDYMVVKPLPWRMCARAVGLQVQLKVWPLAQTEPTWNDPNYAGAVGLPQGWDISGRGGWFAGHLKPGGFAQAADVRTRTLTSTA